MQLRKEFFIYGVTFDTLTHSTNQSKNLLIDRDSAFECIKLTRGIMINADPGITDALYGQCLPNVRVSLYDNGIGKFLTNTPVEMVYMFGVATFPLNLAEPLIFKQSSVITVQVFNDNTVQDITKLQLCFVGRKIYRIGE